MSRTKNYTISVFTEDFIGLLNRVCIVFTRRHLNITSITASPSEIQGIHRYTILLRCTEDQVRKVVAQIDKIVDVLKTFYHEDEQTIYQEIALYKVATPLLGRYNTERVLKDHHARVISMTEQYTVIEKTGTESQTQALFDDLNQIGILEFARSGRVAITKPMQSLEAHLQLS